MLFACARASFDSFCCLPGNKAASAKFYRLGWNDKYDSLCGARKFLETFYFFTGSLVKFKKQLDLFLCAYYFYPPGNFRQADNLLLDLYDDPDEVKRRIWEIHTLWHRFYNEINEVLQPVSPGYSDWAQIYSDKPSYVPQSDFSYMIGPGMFDEFVRPELEETCEKLRHTIYHLDGVGQLAHLDLLLQIKELDAVQWVPGDGKPDQSNWPEVYRKIHHAGKKIQLWHGFDCLDKVNEQIGTWNGIHHTTIIGHVSEEYFYKKRLEKYGIE